MSEYSIDTRKLRKALNELIADVDAQTNREPSSGGFIRGMGGVIGKIGSYYISIDVEEFDTDDLAIFSEVIIENKLSALEMLRNLQKEIDDSKAKYIKN